VVVYVDVLLAVNFMVNFVLLRLVALFDGARSGAARYGLGAFLGALSSLCVFVPEMGAAGSTALRLLVGAGMVLLAFGCGGRGAFLRRTALLFLASFLLSGLLLAVSAAFPQERMRVYRGVVLFDIGLPALALAVAAGYGFSRLLAAILQARAPRDALCMLTVVTERGSRTLPALIDTGSSLTEPFSGLPVIVCEREALRPVLLEEETAELPAGWRLVPVRTVAGSAVLRAFRPWAVTVQVGEETFAAGEVYIALSAQPLGARAIINPALFTQTGCSGKSKERVGS